MSSTTFETPRKRAPDPITPQITRIGTTVQSSPHYSTTRRHSLYGTEDRIVLDPGSRIWKMGFSGEGRPRELFFAAGTDGTSLWSLSRPLGKSEREEEDRLLKDRIQDRLRTVFHECLLTDPKSRKVIIVEHPLLPLYVKDMIAAALFENLQVPSISFANSHLLSLFAVGRITGLVLDCGYLESTALPIFASRPLYPQLRTTPLAGSRLTSHLRALLLMFGTYIPPLTSLSGAANIPVSSRSTRVPEEVLTDTVMEEVKTRCCFVGSMLESDPSASFEQGQGASASGVSASISADDSTEFDVPPSEVSHQPSESGVSSSQPPSSAFSGYTSTRTGKRGSSVPGSEAHLQGIATMYSRHSTATELKIRVDPPASQNTGTGKGTLLIPGWIRERAAEVLFEGGDVDESSVAEVILEALLKVPVDLRRILASSILVAGGTAMLPGFIPRLHDELVRALTRLPSEYAERPPTLNNKPAPPTYDPYGPLRPLAPHIAIVNNPSPSASATGNAGKGPAFTPAGMPWVGGSLAGALKIGGIEIPREKWDEAESHDPEDEGDTSMQVDHESPKRPAFQLPDWTRTPLRPGAPPAPRPPPPVVTASPATASVGA